MPTIGLLLRAPWFAFSAAALAAGRVVPEECRIRPALHAAATSSGPVRSGPMGATTIGASIPNRSQNRVRSMSRPSTYESKMGAIGLTMQLRPQIGSGLAEAI